MDTAILWRLGLVCVLVAFSGFFAGSETAMFSLSPLQLRRLEDAGHHRVALIRSLLARPRSLIATIFIGNELVNIAASGVVASVVQHYLRYRSVLLITVVSTVVFVPVLLVFGESLPKGVALKIVERWSAASAIPLRLLAIATAPLRWIIQGIADLTVKVVGGGRPREVKPLGEREYRRLVDMGHGEGEIGASERVLIHNVFEFGDRTVGELMTPKDKIFGLSTNLSLARAQSEVLKRTYSRVPIYDGKRDNVVGVLHVKDLLAAVDKRPSPGLRELLKKSLFIPKATKASELFSEFQRRKVHIAMVVDEYGRPAGLVTMEDLLEELFGEITDEKERSLPSIPAARGPRTGRSANAPASPPAPPGSAEVAPTQTTVGPSREGGGASS